MVRNADKTQEEEGEDVMIDAERRLSTRERTNISDELFVVVVAVVF